MVRHSILQFYFNKIKKQEIKTKTKKHFRRKSENNDVKILLILFQKFLEHSTKYCSECHIGDNKNGNNLLPGITSSTLCLCLRTIKNKKY